MHLKFLGTGTSTGIPVIGCRCNVCTSHDSKDHRLRSSAIITTQDSKKILIDCGPDFRTQMIQNQEPTADAIILTHEHNDHVIGLDDVRPIIYRSGKPMPVYADSRVCNEVKIRFPYAFADEKYAGVPSFELHNISGEFVVEGVKIIPINVFHGKLPILGFRINNLAYITDASDIPEAELDKLQNLDVLILNCIRSERPHPTHYILPDILNIHKILKPKHIYLTHISHDFRLHKDVNNMLPNDIELAYDGQEINF